MRVFSGQTADEVWGAARDALDTDPEVGVQSSRNGPTRELMHIVFDIADPLQRWVNSREPAINPAFALAEVLWIISGSRDLAFLEFWHRDIAKYVGAAEEVHGAYGWRLRHHFGVDQLWSAADALIADPAGRQVVLQIWDPALDLPTAAGSRAEDIPCNVTAMLKVRGGRLEWTQFCRSNDLFRGVPYNFVQFTSLQEIMAGWIGVEVGGYRHWSDSLHRYETDPIAVASSTTDQPPNIDTVALSRDQSITELSEVTSRARRMTGDTATLEGIQQLALSYDGCVGFRNWLAVLGAEAARRRGAIELARSLGNECSNPALARAWSRWQARVGK
ncbi:MAG TPA: thymidylate synthase [Actinobacteria bacterium]|nr:thymidylate synthase [bacterium BMS3Bbin01]HDL41425.1 thymidylate synthase [Actinomycetota bacterium]